MLNDYYDAEKTIIITTHQVEEIESVLTDLIFISDGKIILDASMESVAENFVELEVELALKENALVYNPIHVRNVLGGYRMIYEKPNREQLNTLGRLFTPSLADLLFAFSSLFLN